MDIETIKQNFKILSLVDGRSPWDNNGCPLYHTRIVPVAEAHEELLGDFKNEMANFGIDGNPDCGYTIEVDGEEVAWGYNIPNMALAEVVEKVGHEPTTYSIVDAEIDRITHTLSNIT